MLGGSWCFSPGERKAERGRWINCRRIKNNALYITYIKRNREMETEIEGEKEKRQKEEDGYRKGRS
jgi:hypothetical protein